MKPHPAIWCPSQGSVETLEWAAHPSRKYVYLQTYSPIQSVAKYLNMYREIAERKYGYKAESSRIGWAAPTYVAETDEKAIEEARPHIETFFNKLLNMPFEMLFPPGYVSRPSLRGMLQHKQSLNAARKQTVEGLIAAGIFNCGSPETVLRKITEGHRLTGFQNYVPFVQFATLPADLTKKSIELFAEKVMPHVRKLDDDNFVGLKALAAE